jgi:addiction module HigA family antidote
LRSIGRSLTRARSDCVRHYPSRAREQAVDVGDSTAAGAPRVSRPALSSLLNGKAALSGEMALRIEKAFGVKMDRLMRMQSAYDIASTRKREKDIPSGAFTAQPIVDP